MKPETAKIDVPPGRLGLGVMFLPSGGAVVTQVLPECPFLGRVGAGDVIVAIDGETPSSPEDMARGNDRAREFEIAKSAAVDSPDGAGDSDARQSVKREGDGGDDVKEEASPKKSTKRKENGDGKGEAAPKKKKARRKSGPDAVSEDPSAGGKAGGNDDAGEAAPRKKRARGKSGAVPPEDPQAAWQRKFYELALYQSRNGGSSIVPKDDAAHADLAKWIRKERRLYKKHKKGETTTEEQADRVAALEQLGFMFDTTPPKRPRRFAPTHEAKWRRRYNELLEYMRANGNCHPNTRGECEKLGKWVSVQRSARREYLRLAEVYRRRDPRGRVPLPEEMPKRRNISDPPETGMYHCTTQEHIDALDAIEGFRWDVAPEHTPWEARFEEFKQFVRENGHGLVPQHYDANPSLGRWVKKMRYEGNLLAKGEKSPLTPEQVRRLEEAGFEFAKRRRPAADSTPARGDGGGQQHWGRPNHHAPAHGETATGGLLGVTPEFEAGFRAGFGTGFEGY